MFVGRSHALQEKIFLTEVFFLHYPRLKFLLSSLPGVLISPTKPSLENVLARVFRNPRKHQSIMEVFYPLVFNIGFKISVKFYGFKTPG